MKAHSWSVSISGHFLQTDPEGHLELVEKISYLHKFDCIIIDRRGYLRNQLGFQIICFHVHILKIIALRASHTIR